MGKQHRRHRAPTRAYLKSIGPPSSPPPLADPLADDPPLGAFFAGEVGIDEGMTQEEIKRFRFKEEPTHDLDGNRLEIREWREHHTITVEVATAKRTITRTLSLLDNPHECFARMREDAIYDAVNGTTTVEPEPSQKLLPGNRT